MKDQNQHPDGVHDVPGSALTLESESALTLELESRLEKPTDLDWQKLLATAKDWVQELELGLGSGLELASKKQKRSAANDRNHLDQ